MMDERIEDEKMIERIHFVWKVVKPLIILLILGLVYLFLFKRFGVGFPCVFYKLTGYQCPGCGMTRAMARIWEGKFAEAMQFNALSLTVFPVICIYALYRWIQENKKRDGFYIWEYFLIAVLFIVVIGYGVIRNLH